MFTLNYWKCIDRLISGKSEPSGSPYTPPGFLSIPYPGYPPPPHLVSFSIVWIMKSWVKPRLLGKHMGIRKVRMSVVNQNVDTIPHFQMSLLSQIKIIRWNYMIYVQNKALQYYFLEGQLESEHKHFNFLCPLPWSLLLCLPLEIRQSKAQTSLNPCPMSVWSIWRNCHFSADRPDTYCQNIEIKM